MSTRTTKATTITTSCDPLPGGTKVVNTQDAEVGVIMNGFAYDAHAGWTEYEVETAYGVEVWRRDHFALMSEMEAEAEYAATHDA